MARQGYYTNPWEKKLESYKNFAGGMNTVTSEDNLKDSEFVNLINLDLGDRGSLKRRYGMIRQLTSPVSGKGQGYFRYFKSDGNYDELIAVGGKLYKGGTDLGVSFQTTRMIEAVQFKDKLYIATGTKLMVYDGTSVTDAVPYTPQPLEALYIGTNGLAADPDNYLTDGEAQFLRIDGVTSTLRYGVVNKATTFTVYVSKPTGSTIEYQFNYREIGSDTWILGKDWSTTKEWNFTPSKLTEYEFDIYARVQGSTDDPARYVLPSYKVYETDKNEVVDTSTIHTCNRILLHWDRIILYGDTTQPEAIYISHLKNPLYIPTPNSLLFENERKEGLSALVRYRDMLVAFTPTSIQALYGKSPQDFIRVVLNTNIGCIAPESAVVMGNYIAFLSREGVHILKSLGYTESRLNVEKIDNNIDNMIQLHNDASMFSYDGQLHVVFPQLKKRFRYYYERQVWTSDVSDKLDFSRMYEWDGVMYGQSSVNGNVLVFDEETWSDDDLVYEDKIETKFYDFGQPNHPKKLKELQLLMAHFNSDIRLDIYVYADSALRLSPDTSNATVDSSGNVVWNSTTEPNLVLDAGTTFGEWDLGNSAWGHLQSQLHKLRVSGKCRRTKLVISHKEATPNQLLGIAYIFKLKTP